MRKQAGLKAGQTAKGTKSVHMIQFYRTEKLPVTSSAQMNKSSLLRNKYLTTVNEMTQTLEMSLAHQREKRQITCHNTNAVAIKL